MRFRGLAGAGAAMAIATACGAFGSTNDDPVPPADASVDAVEDSMADTGFKPATQLVAEDGVFGIAVDTTTIYWTNPKLNHVRTIAKPGKTSSVSDPLLTNVAQVREIQVDTTDVFLARSTCSAGTPAAVFRYSLGDKSSKAIHLGCSVGGAVRMTTDTNSVLYNVHLTTTHTYLAQKLGGSVVVQNNEVYPAGPLAVFGSHVYFTRADAVISMELDAGFANGKIQDLVADATHLYWIDSSGAVFRRAHDAASSAEKLGADPGLPGRLIVASGVLYWTNESEGRIVSLPTTGGAPATIATGQAKPFAIAADEDGVYWTNRGDNTIHMAVRTRR